MPHLTLEYSANIEQKMDFVALFSKMHTTISDIGQVKLDNIKSRARKAEDFRVSDGQPDQAFVHLDFRFLAGRTKAIKQQLGQQLLHILTEAYAPSFEQFHLQITVEVQDIDPAFYFKMPKGTLSVPEYEA